MFNYSQLKCFLTVAEHLNYNRAADALCITPTAVSKQIKNLEHQFGETLFVRDTRNVSLTSFGSIMLDKCQKLIQETKQIEEFVRSRQSIPQGKLKVLVSNILAREFILNRLATFIDKYPLIKCELEFSEYDEKIAQSDIDIMVGFPQIPGLTDRLKYRKMQPAQNILCAAPSLIKKHGAPKTPQDLMSMPFISHSLRKPATTLPMFNGEHLPCPPPILFMDDFNALNQACNQGIGVFLTGDCLVKHDLANNKLVQLLPSIRFKRYEIYTFYRPTGYDIPKIRAFLDFYFPGA